MLTAHFTGIEQIHNAVNHYYAFIYLAFCFLAALGLLPCVGFL